MVDSGNSFGCVRWGARGFDEYWEPRRPIAAGLGLQIQGIGQLMYRLSMVFGHGWQRQTRQCQLDGCANGTNLTHLVLDDSRKFRISVINSSRFIPLEYLTFKSASPESLPSNP